MSNFLAKSESFMATTVALSPSTSTTIVFGFKIFNKQIFNELINDYYEDKIDIILDSYISKKYYIWIFIRISHITFIIISYDIDIAIQLMWVVLYPTYLFVVLRSIQNDLHMLDYIVVDCMI